ncbi:uncharacterized protein LOC119363859 isoform X1 [Triticum dicoccoides]|uniref:Ternary complex factor MIP1 leucine-zipper domain-containing protein n=4 Tax=Triticum TaxID=4564 RepID=A0A9R1RM21_TRITD|nr:uncharacterized protein LOC119363859 isoform X1 [Triticum dicoccoides]XP_037485124.1 uncharacterized protein LOC119363859 isoform X1 [Triticum dicoccoides]XP_044323926.1 uncharacterized protein LOC123045066 isoform X3 [Triticum aestivum]VAH46441.1 unnamed protein product [Triticum turgidum subsp. durum]
MREMEALKKKGHRSLAKAKPVKPSYNYSAPSRHKRSKSDLEEKNAKDALHSSHKASHNQPKLNGTNSNSHLQSETNKGIHPKTDTQDSLRKEIVQLERHLDDQQTVRGALEKALGPNPAPVTLSNESPILQPTNQLIREVATLELEIKHLEQYLLTLYRKAFEQAPMVPSSLVVRQEEPAPPKPSVSSRSALMEETPKPKATAGRGGDAMLHYSCPPLSKRRNGTMMEDCSPSTCPTKAMDSDHGLRSQSALSFRGVCSSRISPSEESLARALRSCHSQPFSFLEEGEAATTSGVVSLADYLGTNVADHIPETPNNLSEEMVRCMAGVYCKLADPPLVHHRASSSPTSSLSSTTSVVSPQYLGDMWSPNCRREATLDSRLINPFHVEGLKEFSGPYNTMVEVPSISRDRPRLREVEDLLQTYKLILHRLESVDLRRMANEEKLAFWINIHNALLMHAYLKHGIPHNHLKKTSLLVKAECKIAGRSINAAAIQGLVLGCSTHCPGQWLRTLLHPRMKSRGSKAGGQWQAFAIHRPEPLLRFALCSGSHSDPAVRVYTPKRLFQQLEAAKEEYIRATVGVRPPDHQHRRGRVLLPKLVEAYARDVGLSPERLLDAAQRCLPESVRAAVQRCRQQQQGTTASKAVVEWAPHRQGFRYLLARDLAFPHLS